MDQHRPHAQRAGIGDLVAWSRTFTMDLSTHPNIVSPSNEPRRATIDPSSNTRRVGWATHEQEVAMDFNSILIGSEEPKRLVEFYTRVLGEPVMSDGGYTGWQVGRGFVTVGPHSEIRGRNPQPGRLIWNIETADVRGEFQRMRDAGAEVVEEPYGVEGVEAAAVGLIATFADPDGNLFQLMSPMSMD
jgi:predicted enzyme related to lactoylglutathione lyase